MESRGAYSADRAAALSGVPMATIYYWARNEILIPSVSPSRVRLWSYSDLLGLRTIAWLRATKTSPDGFEIPATTMKFVRHALGELRDLELGLWTEESTPNVGVDRKGGLCSIRLGALGISMANTFWTPTCSTFCARSS
jgi:hypothetical protein